MITEDYCNFETAKLLKEKGFDVYTPTRYDYDGGFHSHGDYLIGDNDISAPTHQMAIKWLREVYKLHIAILWDSGACIGKNSFYYHIDRIDNYEDKGYNKIGFDFYEEAVEAALKYCLENLV